MDEYVGKQLMGMKQNIMDQKGQMGGMNPQICMTNPMEQKDQMGGMNPQICMANPVDDYVGKQLKEIDELIYMADP
eukprot:6790872-Heterocapsa_arctica.AAC.1